MAQDHDGEPWFCGHCEWEMETLPYLSHIKACLAAHIASWPRHATAPDGQMYQCGKPHIKADADEQEELSRYLRHLDWMASRTEVGP